MNLTFFLIEVGVVAAFIAFCVVLTLTEPDFRPPGRRFRVTDRELRRFLKASATARPRLAARLLTCRFRRYP